MREYFYCIHGMELRLTTDNRAIASAVQGHLRHFEQKVLGDATDLEIRLKRVQTHQEIPIRISPAAQCLACDNGGDGGDFRHSGWRFAVYRDNNRRIINFHEQGLLVIDDQEGQAEGYLVEPQSTSPDLQGILFCHFALIELLRARGVYNIHASALEKDGRGVLIPGFSGQGKTTSCLALLRAGYRCLSDDHPLLRENGNGLELLSFPVKIDVTEKTVEFFPELRAAKACLRQGLYKQYFYIEDLFPHGKADVCKPAIK